MNTFDVIVVGTGGVGSATLLRLAKRGVRVLGIDRFGPAHDRGSSHGQTRLIRQGYFEHPDYVPLLLSAYEIWHELERDTGRQLFLPAGLVEVGPPDGNVLPGVAASARQHGLEIENLTSTEVQSRFPQITLPPQCQAVFEPTAGILQVEACVQAHLDQAQKLGAELRFHEPMEQWHVDGDGVVVKTDKDQYSAARLIVAAGAWSGLVMKSLGLSLRVVRKHLHWFANDNDRFRLQSGCPAFFFELAEGCFYVFPEINAGLGVKAAEHSGGEDVLDPTNLDRSVDAQDQARVAQFMKRFLPGVSTRLIEHSVCMYTLTPDEHFIVDRHPEHSQVCFVAGLSGHGFKMVPVLGDALADLALESTTSHPVEFLGLSRFKRRAS